MSFSESNFGRDALAAAGGSGARAVGVPLAVSRPRRQPLKVGRNQAIVAAAVVAGLAIGVGVGAGTGVSSHSRAVTSLQPGLSGTPSGAAITSAPQLSAATPALHVVHHSAPAVSSQQTASPAETASQSSASVAPASSASAQSAPATQATPSAPPAPSHPAAPAHEPESQQPTIVVNGSSH
jgi:hypothetical protein